MIKKGHKIEGSNVLGITFKDIRVIDVKEFGCNITVSDKDEVKQS